MTRSAAPEVGTAAWAVAVVEGRALDHTDDLEYLAELDAIPRRVVGPSPRPLPPWFVVAVAGGRGVGREPVAAALGRLTRAKARTHRLRAAVAPTRGAAEHALWWAMRAGWAAGTVPLHTGVYGRAAAFRAAWELLADAGGLVLFEPLDAVAAYAERLAPLVHGPDDRPGGVRVVRVPGPG